MNHALSAIRARAAALLPLTTLLAMVLTVREVLMVATAASAATITNAKAITRKIVSIIALALGGIEAAARWPSSQYPGGVERETKK